MGETFNSCPRGREFKLQVECRAHFKKKKKVIESAQQDIKEREREIPRLVRCFSILRAHCCHSRHCGHQMWGVGWATASNSASLPGQTAV